MTNNEPDYKDNLYFPTSQHLATTSQAIDLTEQWNNGKLPLGWYYVRYSSDEIEPAEYMAWYNNTGWYGNYFEREEDIVQVIDVVPSYEDSMTMKDCVRKEFEAVEKYAKLKEVLHIIKHQCELLMPKNGLNPVGDRAVMRIFLDKINEVQDE